MNYVPEEMLYEKTLDKWVNKMKMNYHVYVYGKTEVHLYRAHVFFTVIRKMTKLNKNFQKYCDPAKLFA